MDKRIKEIKTLKAKGQKIKVDGWVRTKRDSKTVSFLDINDGSTLKGLQIVVNQDLKESISNISTGSAISVEGNLVKSEKENQDSELHATSIKLVGNCPNDYPLQKKRHTIEFLREIGHLRVRTNIIGSTMRVRSALSYAIHKYFKENDFVYVHTPLISASDCEGAGEMFQVTTLDLNNVPKTKDNKVDYSKDFFAKEAHLTVSGQLNGETYAMALKNIYTFGPTFRAENSNTKRHLAEFWMIEPEMAFCDLNLDMEVAQDFLQYVIKYVLDNCKEDLEFFDKWVEKGLIKKLENVVKNDFVHITYTEAINILEPVNDKFSFKVSWGCELQTEHEKYLTEEVYKCPVIVTDYPKGVKAFYMKLNDDNKTVRAMDVLVPRLGEIIGGSEREADYDTLVKKIKDANLNIDDYWWYLDLRKYGTAPHSGFGLGFERLVQYVTGMQNIRDVIPYPRAAKLAEF